MKTGKYFFTGISFFIGILCGVTIMSLFSFTKNTESKGTRDGIVSISAAQARTYFKNYTAGAERFNQVINGYMLEKVQLEAMNRLAAENSSLSGFRIYNGKDDNASRIGIVVGVDSKGADVLSGNIYNTDSPNSGPCPNICDMNSQIIGDF